MPTPAIFTETQRWRGQCDSVPDTKGNRPVRKIAICLALVACSSTSGCIALLAGAAGAGTVACTEKEIDCPVD